MSGNKNAEKRMSEQEQNVSAMDVLLRNKEDLERIAKEQDTPLSMVEELQEMSRKHVLSKIAQEKNVPVETLAGLFEMINTQMEQKESEWDVILRGKGDLERIAQEQNAPLSVVEEIQENLKKHVLTRMARERNVPVELLEDLFEMVNKHLESKREKELERLSDMVKGLRRVDGIEKLASFRVSNEERERYARLAEETVAKELLKKKGTP